MNADLPAPPQASPEALALAADALACALLALRPDARLLHVNLSAREMLARGQPFAHSAHGDVTPSNAARRGEFRAALRAAAAGHAQQLHWADGAHPVTATLSPLAAPALDGAEVPVLLLLRAPSGTPFDVGGFAAQHGLSEAETRVLEQLMHGLGPAEVAAALGVSVPTVRSQIVAIRRKTGHHSVPALLGALAGLPPLRRAGSARRRGE
jgi:DNA-binding CsgD family transcriptional regulator